MKVLICEPNHSTKVALYGALETEGFEVINAQDVDQAKFKIILESPDFVLIDWLEFDIEHLQIDSFTHALKRLRPNTLFIFMSHKGAHTAVSTFESLVSKNGADGYLLKPFNPTQVISELNSWLSQSTS